MENSIAKFFDIDVRPPRGGWVAVIDGRQFPEVGVGLSEADVVQAVKRWRQNNDTFVSDFDVEREVWTYWLAREPDRHVDRRMPSIAKMGANFVQAAVRTIAAAASGEEVKVSRTKADERMELCMACPRRVSQGGKERCSACGCYLSFKTALAQERCPIGKWS